MTDTPKFDARIEKPSPKVYRPKKVKPPGEITPKEFKFACPTPREKQEHHNFFKVKISNKTKKPEKSPAYQLPSKLNMLRAPPRHRNSDINGFL